MMIYVIYMALSFNILHLTEGKSELQAYGPKY